MVNLSGLISQPWPSWPNSTGFAFLSRQMPPSWFSSAFAQAPVCVVVSRARVSSFYFPQGASLHLGGVQLPKKMKSDLIEVGYVVYPINNTQALHHCCCHITICNFALSKMAHCCGELITGPHDLKWLPLGLSHQRGSITTSSEDMKAWECITQWPGQLGSKT